MIFAVLAWWDVPTAAILLVAALVTLALPQLVHRADKRAALATLTPPVVAALPAAATLRVQLLHEAQAFDDAMAGGKAALARFPDDRGLLAAMATLAAPRRFTAAFPPSTRHSRRFLDDDNDGDDADGGRNATADGWSDGPPRRNNIPARERRRRWRIRPGAMALDS